MANFSPRLPGRRTVFQAIAIVVLFVSLAVIGLAVYVYKQSVGKFEIRRLSLPTRIYADYTPLKPGTLMQPDDLLEKLGRLGYRSTDHLARAGDFVLDAIAKMPRGQQSTVSIEIYTRAFKHPSGDYPAQPARVVFRNNSIADVLSDSTQAPASIANAALEPELLTSILSDQLENRRPVTLDQIPQSLVDAVISTEDVRYFHHPGVDPIGILRAGMRNLMHRGVAEGGSTLTQQLVKNYYLTSERTFRRKIVEAFMAVILDARYSKKEILEAYLNDIYLGRNRSISILGVGEAARFYFGKPVSEIDVPEAALLAGMIRGPNNYSPFTHPDKALERRKTVLGLMTKYEKITPADEQKYLAAPLPKKPFRERSGLGSIPFYVDRVLQEMARDYDIKDVKGRGLAIYTAIDLNAQDTAAGALEAGLEGLERTNTNLRRKKNPLQGVMIHVDVPSGEIRALVGGRNYDVNQFNRALNSKRPVGSLFKPFVYLTAFEPSLSNQNITPATQVSDARFILKRRFSQDWSPRNYEDVYHGIVTVRAALEDSMNSASVRLGLATGIDAVIKTAHTLGVLSALDNQPSIILGSVGVPPIEMVDAYATIARLGSRLPLRTVRFVSDDRGSLISTGDAVQAVQVFPARDVYLLEHIMEGVVDRGTAAGVRKLGFRKTAAGKTGTTNDKRDAWFVGFTPKTLALTWVGFDDNSPIGVSGGEGAAPIWARYMNVATAVDPNLQFPVPAGIVFAAVDEMSGGLASPQCPKNVIVNEAFKNGTQPTVLCPLHNPQPGAPTDVSGMVTTTDTAAFPGDTTATQPVLGGGIFRTSSGAPPATTEPPAAQPVAPPAAAPVDQTPPAAMEPPPKTNTSAPLPSTNTEAPPPTSTTTGSGAAAASAADRSASSRAAT
jgi:penicillin-binding protein 1B